jgi:hypothetical protein
MSASDHVVPGHSNRVLINGSTFAKISCSYEITKNTYNNRMDVDGAWHRSAVDSIRMTGSIEGQLGTQNNPHADPYLIMDPDIDRADLQIFPLGQDYNPYILTATITNYRSQSNAQSGGISFSFSFESYGEVTIPSDAGAP